MQNMSLEEKAKLVRKWCLISTTTAGSGHPTTCLSATDLMTVLFDKYYSFDLKNPTNIHNDRLVFSKGHASPLFYTLYAMSGAFSFAELKTLRKFSSRLEGHPTPEFPYTEAATGSLGQGLSVGCGLAIGIKRMSPNIPNTPNIPKTFVLLGDGEMAEGQIWEAANFASYNKLSNLVAIVDVNRLGQSQETMFGYNVAEYVNRFKAFGWETISIDGHDFNQIDRALTRAVNVVDKPFAIIARTEKGHGISFLANKEGWHGKPLSREDLEKALRELGEVKDEVVFDLHKPTHVIASPLDKLGVRNDVSIPFNLGDQIATRDVYGKTLAEIAKSNPQLVVLDAEVKNSTFSIDFLKTYPERFVECFIAEQNMVSVAAGLSRFGKAPFVSTFAAFLSRAFDQIRMAWLSKSNIKFVGSHAGVSIGEDGASQMGLEEIAMFGVFPDAVILQPSDAVSAIKLLNALTKTEGIGYLQTLRPKTSVIYRSDEEFPIGGSKILKQTFEAVSPQVFDSEAQTRGAESVQNDGKKEKDVLTVVGTGITVHEALRAYELLKKENIFIRIIDCYSLQPIDKNTLIKSARETEKQIIITVEDHFIHGGLGDFILSAVAGENIKVEKLAVTKHSHSGTKDELLRYAGIDAAAIVEKVKSLIQ